MKKINFGGHKRFILDGQNEGQGVSYHYIQIDRENFRKLFESILTEEQIQYILMECKFEDALNEAWLFLENYKYFELSKERNHVSKDELMLSKNYLLYVLEKINPFLDRNNRFIKKTNKLAKKLLSNI